MKVLPALNESIALSRQELVQLHSELTLLGNYYGLSTLIDERNIDEELEQFSTDWKPYNPNKPKYKRSGLSITSLDGELTGLPDLTSLSEHNRLHGTSYREASFTKLTRVYDACSSLHQFMKPFLPFLYRTHFIKFETGGFFPYHRDGNRPIDAFRIFVPLYTHSSRDFVFLLGAERIHLEKGRPYFINTLMEHALFVFDEPSTHLVMNVKLCRGSVDLVQSSLDSY